MKLKLKKQLLKWIILCENGIIRPHYPLFLHPMMPLPPPFTSISSSLGKHETINQHDSLKFSKQVFLI